MDKEFARHVAKTALACGASLEQLIPDMEAHCSAAEREVFVKAIASAIGMTYREILSRVFAEHPDIEHEIARNVEARGRIS